MVTKLRLRSLRLYFSERHFKLFAYHIITIWSMDCWRDTVVFFSNERTHFRRYNFWSENKIYLIENFELCHFLTIFNEYNYVSHGKLELMVKRLDWHSFYNVCYCI